jgi:hypothetical protein
MHARLRRATAVAIATGALLAAGSAPAADATPGHGHANGHGKGHCRAFHGWGEGVDEGASGESVEGGTTTRATIYRGHREFAIALGTLKPGGFVDGMLSFSGNIVLDNAHGTLSAPVDGSFDTVTGEFDSRSDTVTGTGDYANVTGWLHFWGEQDLTDGSFTETVHGKLCVPKKKQH